MIRVCRECGDVLDEETVGRVCWTCNLRLRTEERDVETPESPADASDG